MAPKKQLQKSMKIPVKLPTQVWQLVLSHLAYFDLKRAQRVNKAFNKLIATPHFDVPLFRAPPPSSPLTPTTRPILHPLLSSLNLVTDNISDIVLFTGKGVDVKMHTIWALKFVSKEMITYPSSSEVRLENLGHCGGSILNYNGEGATILQLLEEVVNCWAEPSDEYDQDEEAEMYEHESEPEMTELTMYQALMQRDEGAEFGGWEEPAVNKEGVVVLTAEEMRSHWGL